MTELNRKLQLLRGQLERDCEGAVTIWEEYYAKCRLPRGELMEKLAPWHEFRRSVELQIWEDMCDAS